ncbi:hexose kinase [Lactiplantibacillus pentosus]|uniref:hexose kinase n=1 Tax=Lactiplantibacillus pentosus TaxID=1589 RepID=UPI003C298651
MILTVTMNPSVDMAYTLNHLNLNDVNRVSKVNKTAGGKGLNVTRVISTMGQSVVATGMLGGRFGAYIKDHLDSDQIDNEFYMIKQESRNSIAILHDSGDQTELLEQGPTISENDQVTFKKFFKRMLCDYSLITMSGSLPQGVASDFYAQLITIGKQERCKVLLDSSGESLMDAITAPAKPMLIKPNEAELQALVNQHIDVTNDSMLVKTLSKPIFSGIEWIVVSLGAKGAFAKHQDNFYRVRIPKIKVKNPVGSGDSTLAGLAMKLDDGAPAVDVLKNGMTMGLLNTMQEKTGCVDPDQYQKYYDMVEVNEVMASADN